MTPRKTRRGQRAQVLALGAVTLVVLGFMLLLSFNLTHAVHEKMRLQQHSDAMAYSMATVEARALNYIAYTNRTIASAYVSMMTVHAYMSAAGLTVSILKASAMNFMLIAIEEAGLCVATRDPTHCADSMQAMKIRSDFSSAADDYADLIERHEKDFNEAVSDLSQMVKALHRQQQDTVRTAQTYLQGQRLDSLKATNAPQASDLAGSVGDMNVEQFACALEGSSIDDQCQSGRAKSSAQARSRVMAAVANAARPDFPRGRFTPFLPTQLHHEFVFDKLRDLQGNEGFAMPSVLGNGGCARLGARPGECAGAGRGEEGKAVSAEDSGGLMTNQWRHGTSSFPFSSSRIASDENGNTHDPSAAHSGTHDRFTGVQPEDVCSDGNCFINFRAEADRDDDFGQPKVYGAYSQDLRVFANGQRGSYEMTNDGAVTFELERPRTLRLVPRRRGMAVSKALVYFHRFDSWRAPPNLFDAYWRAKLHPFKRDEMRQVITRAGFSDDAAAEAAPIEGQRSTP